MLAMPARIRFKRTARSGSRRACIAAHTWPRTQTPGVPGLLPFLVPLALPMAYALPQPEHIITVYIQQLCLLPLVYCRNLCHSAAANGGSCLLSYDSGITDGAKPALYNAKPASCVAAVLLTSQSTLRVSMPPGSVILTVYAPARP